MLLMRASNIGGERGRLTRKSLTRNKKPQRRKSKPAPGPGWYASNGGTSFSLVRFWTVC